MAVEDGALGIAATARLAGATLLLFGGGGGTAARIGGAGENGEETGVGASAGKPAKTYSASLSFGAALDAPSVYDPAIAYPSSSTTGHGSGAAGTASTFVPQPRQKIAPSRSSFPHLLHFPKSIPPVQETCVWSRSRNRL